MKGDRRLTPLQRAMLKILPKPGSGISSVTISCPDIPGSEVTFTQQDYTRIENSLKRKTPEATRAR